MHSLKPSGDNIAQEFLKLVGKKGLAKSASLSLDLIEEAKGLEDRLDEIHSGNQNDEAVEKIADAWAERLSGAMMTDEAVDAESVDVEFADDSNSFSFDSAEDNLEDYITDASTDQEVDPAVEIDQALDAFESMASEKKVLAGLSKIAGSLRAKGEAFAADVVEATAISIKGDLQKEAGRKAEVISELKKLASEFYNSEDTLAGDMVQVTINKLE